ncbi:MAG: PhnD/SsuA/transferrin family substrate-binding protein [Proteobacteria bacterium]|nr:PhnD/SsuA/transferrin family substrate-binding protein [Pseudomonadota bacterium]MBI3497027.1 PhnD/SsuA/transferrin family substrate-binding protein [Pseudomonadota bacterium]
MPSTWLDAGRLPRLPRRQFIKGVLGGVLATAATAGAPARASENVSFGLTPVFLDNDIELLAKLQAYLARKLERPVTLVKRRTYQEITAMLLSGQLNAAWICDDPYVQYQDQLALLAVPVYRGHPLYQTYVTVSERSRARTFDEIRGTVHAFSDPDSTSGYLITRWLLALRQTTPADFFHSFFFTYGHRNVIRAVRAGLAESGSIDGYVWDVMQEREPDLVRNTRIVYRSEWLGFPPIVALQAMRDAPVVKAIEAALLGMHLDELGREILSILALDKFGPGTPDMYESTMEKWLLVKAQV